MERLDKPFPFAYIRIEVGSFKNSEEKLIKP
jgi:hypothetical protein